MGRGLFRQQGIEQEQAGSGDDGGVGYVEVGPMIGEDVDLNEVDHRAVDDAVVDVAEGAAEDEGKGDGGEGDVVAEADESDENDERG